MPADTISETNYHYYCIDTVTDRNATIFYFALVVPKFLKDRIFHVQLQMHASIKTIFSHHNPK